MNKVIVSGASGYFGSLAKFYLEAKGVDVISAGRGESSSLHFDLDRIQEFACSKIEDEIDVFIHAAASHEVDCANFPYNCISRNVAGTRAALDFCVGNNIKQFIYVSTFHVYGVEEGVISEDTEAKPRHDYGLTHLQAEEYVRMYTQKGLIKGLSIRPSNMFDPPITLDGFNRWSLIPFGFCKSAIEEGSIELKTPGLQRRNFVSVRDIVEMIIKISNDERAPEILNIPGITTCSIRDFASLVKNTIENSYGRSVKVLYPLDDLKSTSLSYRSNYFEPEDLGFSIIENHIKEFSRMLIDHA